MRSITANFLICSCSLGIPTKGEAVGSNKAKL